MPNRSPGPITAVDPDCSIRAGPSWRSPGTSADSCITGVSMNAFQSAGIVYRNIFQFGVAYNFYPAPSLSTMLNGNVTDIHDTDEVAGHLLRTLYPGHWTATDRAAVRQALATPVATIVAFGPPPVFGSSSLLPPPLTLPDFPFETQLAAGIAVAMSLVQSTQK